MPLVRTFIVIVMWLITGSVAAVAQNPAAPPAKEKFHLYLLMGQSNMAGRGEMTDADRQPVARVLVLNKEGQWAPAAHPLHFDKPIAGVGLGIDFARTMLEAAGDDHIVIGLIPTAVGGTPLDQWAPDSDARLYARAMERAAKAMQSGTLKGVLWHQGEGDSKAGLAQTYGERLAAWIGHLRKDLQKPNLPIVVGELGHFLLLKQPLAVKVNEALRALPGRVSDTACVGAENLSDKGDGTHFDAASLREFGRRYGKAMIELQRQQQANK